MKKVGLIALVLLLCLGASVFARGEGETARLRMATGGTAGTYYAYGSVLAQILGEKTGIPITPQTTGASKANIQLINAGEAEIAIVQNDTMDFAWNGTDLFRGEQTRSFNSMAGLYAEVTQIIANPSSGIRSVADFRGKNISVGDAGSGVEFNAMHILDVYGLTDRDYNKQNLSFAASADALRDGKIDAFFATSGVPIPAVVDLAASREIFLVPIDDAHAAQMMQKYPFYTRFSIPVGSYRNQNVPVQSMAIKATMVVSTKLSESTVYALTKALFENKAQITAAHAKGNEINPQYAVEGISVPFHPGAARYLREIGALR
jgi:hypothetical protein